MDFVKDHEELHDKINEHYKDKARKECLWERFDNSHKLLVKVCKTWFELQRTHYSKLTHSKSGQASKEMMERQNWIQDKFNFLKMHIRCKGLSKSSDFKSEARGASASAASAHGISRASTDMDSMDISMRLDTTIQPSVTGPSAVSSSSLVNQKVMDQFVQIRTMLLSFFGPKHETT